MKIRFVSVLVAVLAIAPSACAGGSRKAPAAPSSTCPAAGSEVSFGKMMNPTFSGEYEGCSIRTTVKFWSATSMMAANIGDAESVVFEVSDPNVGEGSYEYVKMAKASAAAIFGLKKGDAIVLTGGTHAWPTGGAKTHYFEASAVAPAAAP